MPRENRTIVPGERRGAKGLFWSGGGRAAHEEQSKRSEAKPRRAANPASPSVRPSVPAVRYIVIVV